MSKSVPIITLESRNKSRNYFNRNKFKQVQAYMGVNVHMLKSNIYSMCKYLIAKLMRILMLYNLHYVK